MELRSRASTLIVLIIALLSPALLTVVLARAATPDASQMSDPASKLGMWEGRWPTMSATTRRGTATRTRTTAPVTAIGLRTEASWFSDYLNSGPGNGVPANNLEVFSYSSAAHTYARLGVFKDAKPFAELLEIFLVIVFIRALLDKNLRDNRKTDLDRDRSVEIDVESISYREAQKQRKASGTLKASSTS
jgi:hypothetical protein